MKNIKEGDLVTFKYDSNSFKERLMISLIEPLPKKLILDVRDYYFVFKTMKVRDDGSIMLRLQTQNLKLKYPDRPYTYNYSILKKIIEKPKYLYE